MLQDAAGAVESVQDTFLLAAAVLGALPAPPKLRPWLFALARNDCRRRIRPRPEIGDEAGAANQQVGPDQRAKAGRPANPAGPSAAPPGPPADAIGDLADATMQFSAVKEPADALGDLGDPTVQFSTVSGLAAAFRDLGDLGDLGDTTVQFSVVGQPGDATMQFRVIGETAGPPDDVADFNGYLGQTELRELIRSVLADMKPREREVVELNFRHELFDNDLAVVLGLSVSKAQALAARTRGRLEKSLAALRTALAGRQACPVMGELLADWDGQLTEQTRDLVAWHVEQCQVCVDQARGVLRPTVLRALLPLPPLPSELREKVLNLCSSTAEDAVAYRRRVVRRAGSTWAALFSQAVRWASWASIRAHPGATIATAAVALWVVAAVTVTLLTFAGPRAAHAQTGQPAGSPATHAHAAPPSPATSVSATAAPTTAAARRSPTMSPSAVLTQPSASVPAQFQPSPSLKASKSPSPKPSNSPKPSSSPSPSPSPSKSPSPSTSSSPSSSPTA